MTPESNRCCNLITATLVRCTFLILASCQLTLSASAQAPGDYFPAATGNSWVFASDTTENTSAFVQEATVIDGKEFILVDLPFAKADTVRVDSLGFVWQLDDGVEYLLFDFASTEVSIYDPPPAWNAKKILVSRGVSIDVPIGRFENCVVFDIDRAIAFGDFMYAFAPDVGLVQVMDSTGIDYGLSAAVIDGVAVSTYRSNDPVRVDRRTDLSIDIYPNPAKDQATLSIVGNYSGDPITDVLVVDILGRVVRKFSASSEIVLDTSDWTPGVYFVRLKVGSEYVTSSVLVHHRS